MHTYLHTNIYYIYIYVHTYLILRSVLELSRTRDFPFKLLKEESLNAIAAVGLDRLPAVGKCVEASAHLQQYFRSSFEVC